MSTKFFNNTSTNTFFEKLKGIVSNTRDKKYGKAQHDVGNGWLILTHSSTADKKKMLDKIAKALNLAIKVEII